MLPFAPHEATSQDLSGTPLTLTDDSNYITNTTNVLKTDIATRVITVFDVNDTLLQTINQPQDTPEPYAITKDQVLRFHLVFTNNNTTVYTNDVKFLSTRYYDNVQKNLAQYLRCGCPVNDKVLHAMDKARELYNSAIDSFMTGDDVSAQLNIDDANTYINQAATLC